nr:hypothetical protein [Pseudomonadota bacterium]
LQGYQKVCKAIVDHIGESLPVVGHLQLLVTACLRDKTSIAIKDLQHYQAPLATLQAFITKLEIVFKSASIDNISSAIAEELEVLALTGDPLYDYLLRVSDEPNSIYQDDYSLRAYLQGRIVEFSEYPSLQESLNIFFARLQKEVSLNNGFSNLIP